MMKLTLVLPSNSMISPLSGWLFYFYRDYRTQSVINFAIIRTALPSPAYELSAGFAGGPLRGPFLNLLAYFRMLTQ